VEDFAALIHGDDMDRVKSALSHALEAREPTKLSSGPFARTDRSDGSRRLRACCTTTADNPCAC
jgi:hypothetical protein